MLVFRVRVRKMNLIQVLFVFCFAIPCTLASGYFSTATNDIFKKAEKSCENVQRGIGMTLQTLIETHDKLKSLARIGARIVNLSLGKRTSQSSQHRFGDSGKAIDNVWDPDFHRKSCIHTLNQANPWWEIDLGGIYSIYNIMILNMVGHAHQRTSNIQVTVGRSRDKMTLCAYHGPAIGSAKVLTVYCRQGITRARYVKIQLLKKTWLHLCEVAIMGTH